MELINWIKSEKDFFCLIWAESNKIELSIWKETEGIEQFEMQSAEKHLLQNVKFQFSFEFWKLIGQRKSLATCLTIENRLQIVTDSYLQWVKCIQMEFNRKEAKNLETFEMMGNKVHDAFSEVNF